MNKDKLKSYAPQARKDFIAAVEARAHSLGLSEMNGTLDIAPSEKKGDVTLIAGQAWPAKVHDQRQRLIKRMKKDGFAQTVEAVAYTWFNRFAALRYMEIHDDYLDHGYRVLSSREGGLPEIIAHATDVAGSLPGLNTEQIADMKLAGNQDGELYRLLLVAQCNALSKAMPFLFEHIDDESELLLPGNLERTDSVVAKLVESIAEEDWKKVEVIGWLYQYYISEKKDAVMGGVVKSEDIPAATQLFTPNWIVQYLVQNSVGRIWLMANPNSTLNSQWKYYIEPAAQTPEVQAQLDALIQIRTADDGGSLNPETITLLDPACGSGHILVEAYEVFKAIYLERGYQARAIPRLILEKNLFGIDIDDRAAQMAGFALMMKARADDRRLLDSPIKLNVLSLKESKGLELDEFDSHLKPFGISRALLASLIDTFAHAKTFGSLIQIPEALDGGLPALTDGLGKAIQSGDVFAQAAAQDLLPLAGQATVLAMKFDAVVANPPWMGYRAINEKLKEYLNTACPLGRLDVQTAFLESFSSRVRGSGAVSMVMRHNWMFISTFDQIRKDLIQSRFISGMFHIEKGGWSSFGTSAICIFGAKIPDGVGRYHFVPLEDEEAISGDRGLNLSSLKEYFFKQSQFLELPGCPLAYWATESDLCAFKQGHSFESIAPPRQGMATTDNNTYVRYWYEVEFDRISFDTKSTEETESKREKWFPYNKGGGFRKWYGNQLFVVNYESNGRDIKNRIVNFYRQSISRRITNTNFFFRPSITWSDIGSDQLAARYNPEGFIFDVTGMSCFPSEENRWIVLSLLCSKVMTRFMSILNPTLHFQVGDMARVPILDTKLYPEKISYNGKEAAEIAKIDWHQNETSWGFSFFTIALISSADRYLNESWDRWNQLLLNGIRRLRALEQDNNQLFIQAYGLQDELSPDVLEDQITLIRADREKDSQRLLSYVLGCIMGRYSLDEPGLIYAQNGNVGFDPSRYKTFTADADGIVPITDDLWFEDDATNRVREFLNAVWGAESRDENMNWLAESIGRKGLETPEETIRRYLSGNFYKDHLQTYKKRPIYWHFSSGKQGAFQALVYLHRYHEGTLARMRAEYVVPLTGKMQSRIEMLEKDRDAASATAARTKIAKQIDLLRKKQVELLAYDEKLRHYADMRITLDLDDGVKVNYGKFGDLLAEVKTVTGGVGED